MTQNLSPSFENMLGPRLDAAADVLQLSAFYHSHPGQPTPWEKSFTRPAYLSYFLPLNYARLRSVFRQVRRLLPPEQIQEIWDFGSGPGTTHWVLEDEEWLPERPLFCVESSHQAIQVHKDLQAQRQQLRFTPKFKAGPPRPGQQALAIFSYSFLELQPDARFLQDFEHVLIVEPSTREAGRSLMEWRQRLQGEGFHVLAPCTHAQPCPLLTRSNRDWCHMRMAFAAPDWFLRQEDHLPMKNRTLTYSYLLLSRKTPPTSRDAIHNPARVVGDTLEERGKTRQMICRGPEREFLSWLHRHGEPPRIPHGALVTGLETCEVKGGELRVGPESQLQWSE